jgi:predicted RNA-binding protein YlqC (UPF0109 family)
LNLVPASGRGGYFSLGGKFHAAGRYRALTVKELINGRSPFTPTNGPLNESNQPKTDGRLLISYLAKSLAGRPEDVVVAETPGDKAVMLELTVADEDLNHLIGKHGRTIKAMRSLLAAAAAKSGCRFSLKITGEPSLANPGEADGGPEAPDPEPAHD